MSSDPIDSNWGFKIFQEIRDFRLHWEQYSPSTKDYAYVNHVSHVQSGYSSCSCEHRSAACEFLQKAWSVRNCLRNAWTYFPNHFHDLRGKSQEDLAPVAQRYNTWLAELTAMGDESKFAAAPLHAQFLQDAIRYFDTALKEMTSALKARENFEPSRSELTKRLENLETLIDDVRSEMSHHTLMLKKLREAVGIAAPKTLLIDGTNVCHWAEPASLNYLTSLTAELKEKGFPFICIFDANTRHVLSNPVEKKAYLELIGKLPQEFVEVTGGLRADDVILQRANQAGLSVVSNDRYRDYAEKFPWIENDESRLYKGAIVAGFLTVPKLDLQAEVQVSVSSPVEKVVSVPKRVITKAGSSQKTRQERW